MNHPVFLFGHVAASSLARGGAGGRGPVRRFAASGPYRAGAKRLSRADRPVMAQLPRGCCCGSTRRNLRGWTCMNRCLGIRVRRWQTGRVAMSGSICRSTRKYRPMLRHGCCPIGSPAWERRLRSPVPRSCCWPAAMTAMRWRCATRCCWPMPVRGCVRAQKPTPNSLRRAAGPKRCRNRYNRASLCLFLLGCNPTTCAFAVSMARLAPWCGARAFLISDAVTLLPYDPARDLRFVGGTVPLRAIPARCREIAGHWKRLPGASTRAKPRQRPRWREAQEEAGVTLCAEAFEFRRTGLPIARVDQRMPVSICRAMRLAGKMTAPLAGWRQSMRISAAISSALTG